MKKAFIKLICCALILFSLSSVSVCAAEDLPPLEQGGIHERPLDQV